GGAQDTTARAIAQKLSETWGRQVIVDNRPGATGAIAVELTAKAAPDGYTICLISAGAALNAAVNPKLPYDLSQDLAAVSQASALFYVLFHSPSVPVKSVKELIAYAKANPGKLSYGVPGTGSLLHFAVEMFSHMTGVKLVHVPYKGGAPAVAALLAGEVQLGMATLFAIRPHMPSGRVRLLAITAKQRSPSAPDVPTIAEAGVPGYEVESWYGVVTSAKVPSAIIRKLNLGIAEALKPPDVVQRLAADGSTAVSSTPEEFAALIKSEIAKWRKLVKDARLVLN
ncbi:MAG: tripartite tricarboxylate transporter substrate binding protein, partial [Acidobacteria bacterium]|nr:tripartite tricarboxylate transporter substrate binding protein [Acidobacteriota bacterium]